MTGSSPSDGRSPVTCINLDLQRVFNATPGCFLVLAPDFPQFTILAVTDAYLNATRTQRSDILGKGVFDVFPDNPDDPDTKAVDFARASFQRVVESRGADVMGVRKHDIRLPESEGGGFGVRFWNTVNFPVLGDDGQVHCIVHRVEDVTEAVKLKRQEADQQVANKALLDSRAAALNLMRDAVASRQQAEQASEKLREEILERKRAEEATQVALDRFHMALASMTFAALLVSDEGRVEFANRAFCDIFHLKESPAELAGLTSSDMLDLIGSAYSNSDQALAHIRDITSLGVLVQDEEVPMVGGRTFLRDFIPLHLGDRKFGRLWIHKDITDRKQAEVVLRQLATQRQIALDAAHLGWWHYDPITQISSWDERYREMFGVTGFERPNDEILARIHPDDLPQVWAAVEAALDPANPKPYVSEFRIFSDADTMRWIEAHGLAIFEGEGESRRATSFVGTVQDITDRKRAEEEFLRKQADLEEAQRTAHIGSWTWNADTGAANATEEFYRIFGLDPEADLGAVFSGVADQVYPRPSWEMLDDAVQTAVRTGTGFELDVEALRRGDPIWITARGEPVRNTGGQIVGLRGTVQDVTERKRVEARLRDSERLYRGIGESIDYGVWVCEPDGRNIYASESFLNLVGMTQEECSNFGWGNVLHPDDAERTIAEWKDCVRTGGTWDIEHRYRGVDGEWHAILARGVPVRNDAGEVICWAGINLDISRLKQAEEAMRQADRAKDEFLATLSHELRNPLTAISNAATLIEMNLPENQALRKSVDILNRTVRHTVRLVDDLLDVSRITHGKLELRSEVINLVPFIEAIAENARAQMSALSHTFSTDLPNAPVWVMGDPMRLEQAIGNLLRNAAKYTEAGGKVTLALCESDGDAIIRVRDNGCGIEPALLNRVFDRFAQEDRLVDRSRGGLGIGLALVKSLVELHGGSVEALSDGPSRGSEFVIRLQALTEGAVEQEAPGSPVRHQARSILVVDDNADAGGTMSDILIAWGHTVEYVHDGPTALDSVSRNFPDVVLLDIGLPGMDGFEVAKRLREYGRKLTLIALTGHGHDEDRRRSSEAGFDHHFVKPVDLDMLRELLSRDGSEPD